MGISSGWQSPAPPAACRRGALLVVSLSRFIARLTHSRRTEEKKKNKKPTRVGRYGQRMAACSLHSRRPHAFSLTLIQLLGPRRGRRPGGSAAFTSHAPPSDAEIAAAGCGSCMPRGRGTSRDRCLPPRPQPRCVVKRWAPDQGRRDGLPAFGGAHVDVTLVSPVQRNGASRPGTGAWQNPPRSYPELAAASWRPASARLRPGRLHAAGSKCSRSPPRCEKKNLLGIKKTSSNSHGEKQGRKEGTKEGSGPPCVLFLRLLISRNIWLKALFA